MVTIPAHGGKYMIGLQIPELWTVSYTENYHFTIMIYQKIIDDELNLYINIGMNIIVPNDNRSELRTLENGDIVRLDQQTSLPPGCH